MLAYIFGARAFIDKANKIDRWAQKFGIGSIKAGWRRPNYLGSDFNDPILKTPLELTFASFGSRQLLTIITQLFWSEPGDTILIEEPEISLHPGSQVLLQELFAEIVGEGKQIICTTHSPFFILALSKIVENKKLSKDDIAVYHVEKKEQGTKIRELELNEKGFLTNWIPSYLKVEDDLFREWAEKIE
jgi:predicted ATPase